MDPEQGLDARSVSLRGQGLAVRAITSEDAPLGYWSLQEGPLPLLVAVATVVIEDRRFDQHCGVDLRALARATVQNLQKPDGITGSSTPAPRLARTQGPAPPPFPRAADSSQLLS